MVSGFDLQEAPAIASVVNTVLAVQGVVRVHARHLERGRPVATNHTGGMDFFDRLVLHIGRDVLANGGPDYGPSAGDISFKGRGVQARNPPRQSSKPLCHLHHQDRQARWHHIFVLGPGIDLEGVLRVTKTPPPPTSLKKRLRRAGHFENGVSLLRSPTEKQASDYHRLGTIHGAEGGETSRFGFEDNHVKMSAHYKITSRVIGTMHWELRRTPKIQTQKYLRLVCE